MISLHFRVRRVITTKTLIDLNEILSNSSKVNVVPMFQYNIVKEKHEYMLQTK